MLRLPRLTLEKFRKLLHLDNTPHQHCPRSNVRLSQLLLPSLQTKTDGSDQRQLMDRFTFILQLLLTFRGHAGASNLINIPLNESSKRVAAFCRSPWLHGQSWTPGPHYSYEHWVLRLHSWFFVPFYSHFKVVLMVPAPRVPDLWRAGPAAGYRGSVGTLSTNTVTYLSPKTGRETALKLRWWCSSLVGFIVFLPAIHLQYMINPCDYF